MLKGPAAVLRGNKTKHICWLIHYWKEKKCPLQPTAKNLRKEKQEVTQAHQHTALFTHPSCTNTQMVAVMD